MASEKNDLALDNSASDNKNSDDLPTGLKSGKDQYTTSHDVEIANGHLADLEVDIGEILHQVEEEGDYDADTSPFPAVRAVVPETDDPAIPVNTFRAWLLGIVRRNINM